MTTPPTAEQLPVVFILDCDNTLLDNDALKADLDQRLRQTLGAALTERFWQVYEEVRISADTVDIPQTFEQFRADCPDESLWSRARAAIMDYPFDQRLYPATLATLRALATLGEPVIVSDGDQIYQLRKIERSGLAAAVAGRVLIYKHKEAHLSAIFAQWPARYYVMIDDKARILSATKRAYPNRIVAIHVRQGHYAADTDDAPPADITIAAIADLQSLSLSAIASHLAPA